VKPDDVLRENIQFLRSRTGLTVRQFAAAVGMKESTFKLRCSRPGTLRWSEIQTMRRLGMDYGIDITGRRLGNAER